MAIVDINQIELLRPGDAASLSPLPPGHPPAGAIINGAGHRTTLYDPMWGYYTFGQSVSSQWSPGMTAQTEARFTITGAFTAAAEGVVGSEADTFNALTAKYDALEAMLRAAVDADDPDDYADWATASDPRVVPLPEPLRDKDANRIHAHPESIRIGPGPYTEVMSYTVVLREARRPVAKLSLNGVVVDSAVIVMTPPAPQLREHNMIGANGSVVQVKNYSRTTVELSCTVPARQGPTRVSSRLAALIESCRLGNMAMVVTERMSDGSERTTPLWPHLHVLAPNASQSIPDEQGAFRVVGSL